jgi:hypothetical protein
LLTYFTGFCVHGNTTFETPKGAIFSMTRRTLLNIYKRDFVHFSLLVCSTHLI